MVVSARLRNLAATTIGQVGEGLLAFIFVPIFLRRLGSEAWGLTSLIPLANGVLMVVGFPLTTAINRELARLAALGAGAPARRRTLRAIQAIFLVLAGAAVVASWFGAPWLAERWLRPETLAVSTCVASVRLVGLYVAVLLLRSAYLGALFGMNRQIEANAASLGAAVAVTIGGLAAIELTAPSNADGTVVRFLAAQAAIQAVGTLVAALLAWRGVSVSDRGVARRSRAESQDGPIEAPVDTLARRGVERRDDREDVRSSAHAIDGGPTSDVGEDRVWRRLWPFVRGMLLVAVAAGLVTQVDKLVASRLLTLGDYGLYAVAATLASGIGLLVRAVNMASFPDLSRAFATDDAPARLEQGAALHRWARAVAVVVLPAGATMAILPSAALSVWLGPEHVAPIMPPVLAALAIGWTLNGLAAPAFNTAFAAGWTGFAATQNIIAIAFMPLAMVVLVPRFGATGAALAWTSLNALYVLVSVPTWFFRRLLRAERRRWLVHDVALPVAASVAAVAAVRLLAPPPTTRAGATVACAIAAASALACSAAVARPGGPTASGRAEVGR
ncbi:MAG: hypothetical protein U0575_10100 [Phycisphaerales bacterium]